MILYAVWEMSLKFHMNKIYKCLPACTTQLSIILIGLPLRCLFITGDAVDKEITKEFNQLEDHDDGDPQKETERPSEAGSETIRL